jgi:hypothetical protein
MNRESTPNDQFKRGDLTDRVADLTVHHEDVDVYSKVLKIAKSAKNTGNAKGAKSAKS